MGLLVFVVVLTLLISAQCSLFEATLYSSRVGTLEAAAAKGQRKEVAVRFLQMKRDISVPIAAILILNTVANTAGATFSGMYAAQVFGAAYVPVFSAGLTLGILFLAEILPKTVGAVYWRHLWPLIVQPLAIIQSVLYPAVYITEKFANFFTGRRTVPAVTEDEILAMTRLGARAGEISPQESAMVHSIIELEEKPVRDIFTPRTVVFSLGANTTVAEALKAIGEKGFSRIPVYEEEKDDIIGYIRVHDLLSASLAQPPETSLKTFVKPIAFVPDTANCLTLLTTFLKQRRHIAVVVDEYGGVAGIVTLEDLIETALGTEIVDETDRVVDLRKQARHRRPRL